MIKLEDIDARLEELRRREQQALANFNAIRGAIEDSLHWRAKLEEAERREVIEDAVAP